MKQSIKRALQEFYGPARRTGLKWHEPYALGGIRYLSQGLDIEHPAGTHWPALSGGKVVSIQHSAALGTIVTVDHRIPGPHRFVSYLHAMNPTALGKSLKIGDYVCEIADKAHGGTQSTGPHGAIHTGRTLASALGVGTSDPATLIRKKLCV
jgi:hypothetical protein